MLRLVVCARWPRTLVSAMRQFEPHYGKQAQPERLAERIDKGAEHVACNRFVRSGS
jgi:hypothetical protein